MRYEMEERIATERTDRKRHQKLEQIVESERIYERHDKDASDSYNAYDDSRYE